MKLEKDEKIEIKWSENINKHIFIFRYKGVWMHTFNYYSDNCHPEDVRDFIWRLDRDEINKLKVSIDNYLVAREE